MKVTPNLIHTAMIRLLRERQLYCGRIGLETLRQAWEATGLRASDLMPCLRSIEIAGIIRLHGDSFGGNIELTRHGAEVLNASTGGGVEQDWFDDIALYRIRQRSLIDTSNGQRRITD